MEQKIMFGPIALGAALGFGQSMYQNKQNQLAQEDTQRFSDEQARLNRDWQERMSNTAYQRQKADLKSAGMNPMLAINQGGASTPGGGMASSPGRPPAEMNITGGMAAAAQVAQQAKQMEQQEKLTDASVRKTNTEIGLGAAQGGSHMGEEKMQQSVYETGTKGAEMASARQKNEMNRQDIEIKKLDRQILESTKQATADTAKLDAAQARADLQNLPYSMTNRRIQQGAKSAKDIMDVVKPKINLSPAEKETQQLHRAGKYGIPTRRN